MYSVYSTQIGLQSRFGALLFVIGKFMRFGIFLFFILLLSSSVKQISGYTFWEMILVFATFNLIDVAAQLFFREVYRFGGYVIDGSVDYFLVRPIKPIFRFLFGGADILDVPLLIISLLLVIFSLFKLGDVNFYGIILYVLLIINAFLIVLSFHVFILAIGVLSNGVDNTLFLYRDITAMGKIPIDLYKKPLSSFLTFVIPIGIMITFPAQAASGQLMPQLILISFMIGGIFLLFSSITWRFALRRYSSASS